MAEIKINDIKETLLNIFNQPSLKLACSLIVILFNWLFEGKVDTLFVILALIILDTITGVWKACKLGVLCSHGFFQFSTKLIVYFLMMATCSLVDKAVPYPFAIPIMTAFLSITEAISVFENIALMGFPVPNRLLKMLRDYNQQKFTSVQTSNISGAGLASISKGNVKPKQEE